MRGKLDLVRFVTILMALAGPLVAQSAAPPEDAVAKQRQAATAMQESLAKQQASIRQQTGTMNTGGFFVLPRAASLGGVTGSLPASSAAAMPMVFNCDPLPAPQVESLVGETAEREGLSPDLLRSVMKQESGYRPCAVSSQGAMGLMQLMPGTAEDLGIADPFDAASNVDGGARFLEPASRPIWRRSSQGAGSIQRRPRPSGCRRRRAQHPGDTRLRSPDSGGAAIPLDVAQTFSLLGRARGSPFEKLGRLR